MKNKDLFLILLMACCTSCSSVEEKVGNTDKPAAQEKVDGSVYGIDISVWQGDVVALLSPKNDSLSFVICKATEGTFYTDPDFAGNWTQIKAGGFVRGAYHFYHCDESAHAQVAYFLSVLRSLEQNDLPPIVDVEEDGMSPCEVSSKVQDSLLAFLQELKTATGRTPIIYTDGNTGDKYLDDPAFTNYPLYIADWDNETAPELFAPWENDSWVFWQKTDTYPLQPNGDDLDEFNGDLEALKKFIRQN
jgi:lysozyme